MYSFCKCPWQVCSLLFLVKKTNVDEDRKCKHSVIFFYCINYCDKFEEVEGTPFLSLSVRHWALTVSLQGPGDKMKQQTKTGANLPSSAENQVPLRLLVNTDKKHSWY